MYVPNFKREENDPTCILSPSAQIGTYIINHEIAFNKFVTFVDFNFFNAFQISNKIVLHFKIFVMKLSEFST